MKVTAITLTGDRKIAFSLCQRWTENQAKKPDQWLIIDDGKMPLETKLLPSYAQYVRREPKKSDPKHTMISNIKEGIKYITGDIILFLEDDEYYSPVYIKTMADLLKQYEIAGIGRSKYYHIAAGKYRRHMNLGHASLAQTAFRSSFLPEFISQIEGDMFLDIRVWTSVNGKDAPACMNLDLAIKQKISEDGRGIIFDDGDACLYVGIKGMPERPGIGAGHDASGYDEADFNRDILKRWMPGDYQVYLDMLGMIPISKFNDRRSKVNRYRAKSRGQVGRVWYEKGREFSYDGPKGNWMEPIGDGPADVQAPGEDILKAAERLARKPASALDHKNIPPIAVEPIGDAVPKSLKGSFKGKKK